ncbi:MAG: polysaccharide biosynthesis/export family protein [Sedimentisphaerales bacterium]|nr:polysaccharide biosynthesis/export family protein [Sedimentisphaerales bacterium]
MGSIRRVPVVLAVIGLSFAGCDNKLLDPTQVGRFRPTPAVNVILDSLGVAEETPVAWENAEEPRPKDIVAQKGDYALRPADLVQISIYELFQEGVPLVGQFLVSETGHVSIPDVGHVQAAGLTETQLEDEIKRMLSPNILKEPTVTVTLADSQQRTFSVMGNGVPRPGRFLIPRYDFRLTDALATAGGPMQFNVSYVYLSRKDETQVASTARPAAVTPGKPTARPELELLGPRSGQPNAQKKQTSPEPQPLPSVVPGGRSEIPEPREPAEKFELEREMLDMIAPSADKSKWPTSTRAVPAAPVSQPKDEDVAATVMPYGFQLLVPPKATQDRLARAQDVVQTPMVLAAEPNKPAQATLSAPKEGQRYDWVFRDGQWVPVPVKPGAEQRPIPKETGPGVQTEWVFRDGQWVQIRKGETPAPTPPAVAAQPQIRQPTLPIGDEQLPPEVEWEQAAQTRVLRIPTDKLLAGDPRYNVVIRPGDTLYVPVDIIGEFFIMGNVNRSGVINLTGRPMTLKMAIAAAGGLGPLAWPKTVEVVRRIGKEKEEIVMVDLDRIAAGEQPDFFIKPHDLINVGTHPSARWRAVLRNAFRAAYGFGFVYDRNFVDVDFL